MKKLTEHLQEYFDWRRSLKLSPLTIEKNSYGIEPFIEWLATVHGVTVPQEIYRDHLYGWQKYLSNRKNLQGHPIRPRTINSHNGSIKGFLSWLADQGHIPREYPDLLQYVKKPFTLPKSVLTHDKMRILLDNIPTNDLMGYRDRAMLELLYSTGVRAAELLGLNTFDADLKNRTMMVTGKGEKQRVVPMGKGAAKHLSLYISSIRPYLLQDVEQTALFLSRTGKRLSYQTFLRCVRIHSRRMGFNDVSPHTFRRSCTTELVRSGANIYHVKELLGHESLDTLKHYTMLTINDLKKTHEQCHPRERDNRDLLYD